MYAETAVLIYIFIALKILNPCAGCVLSAVLLRQAIT